MVSSRLTDLIESVFPHACGQTDFIGFVSVHAHVLLPASLPPSLSTHSHSDLDPNHRIRQLMLAANIAFHSATPAQQTSATLHFGNDMHVWDDMQRNMCMGGGSLLI